MSNLQKNELTDLGANPLLVEIKTLIEEGRNKAIMAVNSTLTLTYWQIGRRINQEVLRGERAEYGKQVVELLAKELILFYGKSFAARNIRRMMQFAETFPNFEIVSRLVSQLRWTHFTLLLPRKRKNFSGKFTLGV